MVKCTHQMVYPSGGVPIRWCFRYQFSCIVKNCGGFLIVLHVVTVVLEYLILEYLDLVLSFFFC